jgi:ParB family transcriptional regulator, chromosome partitioning protein
MAEFSDIPLNLLVKAPENVRKAPVEGGVESLVASIRAFGILENLIVYPEEKDDGTLTGKFAVAAGERRRSAGLVLVKAKHWKKTEPVPCRIYAKEEAVAISLTENSERAAMNPADQFEAYAAMIDGGMTIADVAARFGASELVVRQRLKLGRLSPKILDELRSGAMSLGQAQALTLTEDHAMQERAWFNAAHSWDREPRVLRAAVNESCIAGTDPRARLVGLDAYTAAGGQLVQDLFDDAYVKLRDVALLDSLAEGRLQEIAEALRAEGVPWADVALSTTLDHDSYPCAIALPRDYTGEEEGQLQALAEELDDLYANEELTDEQQARLDAAEVEVEAIEQRAAQIDPKAQPFVGAVVVLQHGEPYYRIERSLLRAADYARLYSEGQQDEPAEDDAVGTDKPSDDAEPVDVPAGERPISGALIRELTAERTMALRVVLAHNPTVALVAAAHAHALHLVYGAYSYELQTCLDLTYRPDAMTGAAPKIKESPAALALAEERDRWRAALPADPADLWDFLMAASIEKVLALHAFGVSQSVLAVVDVDGGKPTCRSAHADRLAMALDLDMNVWWSLERGDYLGRVSKDKIAAAVAEGVSPQAADNIAGLKKAGMVAAALDRLAGTGWLPKALRTPTAGKDCDTVEPIGLAAE